MIDNQIFLFGPGRIDDAQGQPLALRSRRQLALLAYLTTEHQVAHSRDALMALLWPDEPTPVAQNNLRVTLSRLRELDSKLANVLERSAGPGDLLRIDRASVRLNPAWVQRADVNAFTRLLESVRRHGHAERRHCATCQASLAAAVQLVRGSFLEGFSLGECPGFEEWLFMQRERLHLAVIEACADLAGDAEANGDLAAARRFAQRQIDFDPLREPAYRQLMRVLARLGERSQALAAFERCRAVLRRELGLDPEAETLALHTQLLADNGPAPAAPVLVPSPAPPQHNLPHQLTSFIGREPELAQIRQRLQTGDARLLSIVAPGGMGKTRLALHAAAENLHLFPQGAWFVPLAGVHSVSIIPSAIMDALGLSFTAGAASPTQQLFAALAKRHLLLVLDNFEQLQGKGGGQNNGSGDGQGHGVDFLLDLLRAAPRVTLLVTTRTALNCQAEDLYELRGLPTPPPGELAQAGQYAAVRLFCDRAYRLTKDFTLTPANTPDVVRICTMVEGLPLAIELATTWLRNLDCAELAAAIAQDQATLATTQRDVPARHRSMHAIFVHTWAMLSPAEQHLLSTLAVCPGPFSVQAAAAMTGATPADLTHLRNKSLLRSTGAGCYEFHPLLRQFAQATLNPSARTAAEAHLAAAYAHFAAEQGGAFRGSEPQAALQAMARELDNIHHGWEWAVAQGRDDLLLQSLSGLADYYAATGRSAEGEVRLLHAYTARAADRAPAVPAARDLLCLRLLDEACRCLIWQGKLAVALTWTQTLVTRAQAVANVEFEARGLNYAGNALHQQGKGAEAAPILREALALARRRGKPGTIGDVLHNLAVSLGEQDQRTIAEAYLLEALQFQREVSNRLSEQRILVYLSRLRFEDYDFQGGQRYLAAARDLLQLTGSRPAEARIVNTLGYAEAVLGNYPAAIEQHAASRRISREIQQPVQESHALHNLCTVQRKAGNLTQAIRDGQEALRLALVNDFPDAAALAQLHLGYAWLDAGELSNAEAAFQAAYDTWSALGRANQVQEVAAGLAGVSFVRGDLARAYALIAPLVPELIAHVPEGFDEPFDVSLTCYRILVACGDPQATPLLSVAYSRLEALAAKITDKHLLHTFWHAAPAHRQLRELWQKASPK